MTDVSISTKRTAVNTGVITMIAALITKATGIKLSLSANDLIALAPAVAAISAVGYRISRLLTSKFPALSWVLFGSGKEPAGIKTIGQ